MAAVRLTGTHLLRRYRPGRLLPLLALIGITGLRTALAVLPALAARRGRHHPRTPSLTAYAR
jgi:hypothetical protein